MDLEDIVEERLSAIFTVKLKIIKQRDQWSQEATGEVEVVAVADEVDIAEEDTNPEIKGRRSIQVKQYKISKTPAIRKIIERPEILQQIF